MRLPARSAIPDLAMRGPRPDDLEKLHEIEKSGTLMLAEAGFASLAQQLSSRAAFEDLLMGRDVTVAAVADAPVGFAVAGELDGIYWLHEMGVDPAHARSGIGTALLSAVIERAKWAFHTTIGLTTFRDVPFNRPFYEKRGFLVADIANAPPAILERFAAEVPDGVLPSTRVFMIRRL